MNKDTWKVGDECQYSNLRYRIEAVNEHQACIRLLSPNPYNGLILGWVPFYQLSPLFWA